MHAKAKFVSIAVLLLQAGISIPSLSTDYFVSQSGSDLDGDGSFSNPWQTLEYAMDRLNPGDVLYIRAGEYHEQLISVRDGSAEAPITVAAYGNELVYIDGAGVTTGNNGCLLSHSHMKFRGFNVRNWRDDGMSFYGCSYLELKKITITAVTGGISMKGTVHDFLIDSCIIYDYYGGAGGYGLDCTPEGETDLIYKGTVQNCKAYITAGAFDNADGFALGHDGVSDIRFHNCETWGIGDGFDISGTDIVLTNCAASKATYGGGYKLWRNNVTLINCIGYDNGVNVELDYDAVARRGVAARLINCTLHTCYVANVGIENPGGGNTLQLFNCIISGGENTGLNFYGDSISCYTGDYNLWHMSAPERAVATGQMDFSLTQIDNGEWTAASGQDAHSRVESDAGSLFLDSSRYAPDLRLRAGSRAINGGAMVKDAPSADFNGFPRGEPIDIGAYEFGSGNAFDAPQDPQAGWSVTASYPEPVTAAGLHVTIEYRTPEAAMVTLSVADAIGRTVRVLDAGFMDAGIHRVVFMPGALPVGTYFYVLRSGATVTARKCLVVR